MKIVTEGHWQLMQEQLAQARHGSEDRIRERDVLIAELNHRCDELQRRNEALTQEMLGWQRERMKPVEMPEAPPGSWEERAEREIQWLKDNPNAERLPDADLG